MKLKYLEFILESKKSQVEALLSKTVDRGATEAEEETAYEKAVELIKKNKIDPMALNVEDDVFNKLKKEFNLKDKPKSKPDSWYQQQGFKKKTNDWYSKTNQSKEESFNDWVYKNYNKVIKVGNDLETLIKSMDLPYYAEDKDPYTGESEGGWEYSEGSTPLGGDHIEYIFPFYPPTYLEKYKKFIDTLSDFNKQIGNKKCEISNSRRSYADFELRIRLSKSDIENHNSK
ncbi:MAG: hypothetical protein SLAVMIC_00849 [uncultured marine phage]|uniref:DUF2786 domain-containing protein n=1 Tax=uncultured marine phage TaxID=707152 RepID=A0A8D9CC96_9VIRU|nr:MAG: hypothetical protein SLAVMIC_00849 [uncultured marine phage]